MFRFVVFLIASLLCCSCVWNGTDSAPDYLPLDDSEFPYAELPRLVIETEGFTQIQDKETSIPAKLQIYGKNAPESEIMDLTLRGRGNSSFVMTKYGIKLSFEEKQELFGMPKDKEWDLISNHRDKSFLRNYITYQLAKSLGDEYAVRTQFVEVFLNRKYLGVYQLAEHPKVAKKRIRLPESDYSYFFEKTSETATDGNLITSNLGYIYDIRYPKHPSEELTKTLIEHINAFETFLQSKYVYNTDSISKWIDLNDLIRYYWIQEFSLNTDGAFRRSQYITWLKDTPMQMGPVWDFDIAYGISSNGIIAPDHWYVKKYGWYRFLFKNKQFQTMVKDYWMTNRDQFKDLPEMLEQKKEDLSKAMKNEFKRWPVLGNDSEWPFIEAYDNYDDAVNALENWIRERIDWIDGNQ